MYVTIPSDHVEQNLPLPNADPIVPTQSRAIKAGAYLFHEGDDATRIYQVVSGVLRLTRVMEDGRRQVIAFGYPGDIVGFPACGQHHTDCNALTPATVIPYRRDMLETGEGDPELHRTLLQAALREISNMQDHFMMLGRKSATEKVSSFLSVLADRVGAPMGNYTQVDLPMSRSDIADFLGLTTETISRTLTQLRKSRIIALENIHTVIILKPETLRAMAQNDD